MRGFTGGNASYIDAYAEGKLQKKRPGVFKQKWDTGLT